MPFCQKRCSKVLGQFIVPDKKDVGWVGVGRGDIHDYFLISSKLCCGYSFKAPLIGASTEHHKMLLLNNSSDASTEYLYQVLLMSTISTKY